MSQDEQISEGPTCIDALTSKLNLAPGTLFIFMSTSKEKE
jgi:hypothetical protein